MDPLSTWIHLGGLPEAVAAQAAHAVGIGTRTALMLEGVPDEERAARR